MVSTTQWLKHYPVGLFASVMGTCGLSLACQRYSQIWGWPDIAGLPLLVLAYVLFFANGFIYAGKLVWHRSDVADEFDHPVRLSFFPTITIGMLLLGIGTIDYHRDLAALMWASGTAGHFLLTLAIVSRWITRSFEIIHINPVWFLPVVGNILVPIVGVELGFTELSWFFFTIGLVFWLVLFVIIFYRILFHPELPEKMMPTLFILMAPPAVGFISYTKLTGAFDYFARILIYLAFFLLLVLACQIGRFRRLRFTVTWWAYTFPVCAVSIATTLAYKMTGYAPFAHMATGLVALSFITVLTVLIKTLLAFQAGTICRPEE